MSLENLFTGKVHFYQSIREEYSLGICSNSVYLPKKLLKNLLKPEQRKECNYPDTKHSSLPVLGITLPLTLQISYPFLKHKKKSYFLFFSQKRKLYVNLCGKKHRELFPLKILKEQVTKYVYTLKMVQVKICYYPCH